MKDVARSFVTSAVRRVMDVGKPNLSHREIVHVLSTQNVITVSITMIIMPYASILFGAKSVRKEHVWIV